MSHPQANLPSRRAFESSLTFWGAIVLTGVAAGLGGGLLMRLLFAVQHLAWSYSEGGFVEAVARAPAWLRVAITSAAGLIAAASLMLLRLAKGGNAHELTLAIWFRDGRMPVLRTLAKAVLSIVIVGLGAAVGREGALKQSGALAGYRLARGFGLSAPERRLLTACGAGAGLAAAYNLPLGGAVFALEVLIGRVEIPFVLPALICSLLGAATSWLLLPNAPSYATPTIPLSMDEVWWAILIGPIAGFVAVAYIRLMDWAHRGAPRRLPSSFLALLAVFSGLGAASIWLPQLLGNGHSLVQALFSGPYGAAPLLAVLVVLRPVAAALCLKTGAPGGLLTPTMTCGALLGAFVATLAPALGLAGASDQAPAFAVMGSAALLAAATSGPVSALVIVIELGRHLDFLIAPVGISIAGATAVTRLLDMPSIYSSRLRADVERSESEVPAGPDGAPAISTAKGLLRLPSVFLRTGVSHVTVVDKDGRVIGRVSRAQTEHELTHGRLAEVTTAGDLVESSPWSPSHHMGNGSRRPPFRDFPNFGSGSKP